MKKFLENNIKIYTKIVIPAILDIVSEDEMPGNLHELSVCINDGSYVNKYLLLTSKQILKIYVDKEKIEIESIYLKEITGFKLEIRYSEKEEAGYFIEKAEIKLKDRIFEIEFDEKMQYSQTLDNQKRNAFKFVKTLNDFIN
jgi:hypothetical protein